MYENHIYNYLDNALDLGLPEREFWEMTLLEYDRFIASRKRVLEAENRQRASFDYIMADLIGKSIARLYSKDAIYPEIYEVYPIIFNKEEIEAKRKEQALEKSVAQFTQFTKSFNKNFKKEAK